MTQQINDDDWAVEMIARNRASNALAVAEERWFMSSDDEIEVLAKMRTSVAILLGRLCQTAELMDFIDLHFSCDQYRDSETGYLYDEFGAIINETDHNTNNTNQGQLTRKG